MGAFGDIGSVREGDRCHYAEVDGLLGLSDARASALQLETVPLARLVEEVLEQLDPEVTAIGATVERHRLPAVTGDGRLLRVLVQNLLSNACASTPLTVRCRSTWTDATAVGTSSSG